MESAAHVLVVDDTEANRDMLSRRLQRRGFIVSTASGGQAALDLIAANRYDLVILDLVMPEVDGLQVLQRLRETWSAAELPVIIATAKDESEDIVDGLKAGGNDYVTKPLDMPVVLARIQTQLSLKNAVDQIKQLERRLGERNQELEASNHDLTLANARMEREMRAAARIQMAMLPSSLPQSPHASFAWLFRPCADDPDARETMSRTLRQEGWTVTEAENGRDELLREIRELVGVRRETRQPVSQTPACRRFFSSKTTRPTATC